MGLTDVEKDRDNKVSFSPGSSEYTVVNQGFIVGINVNNTYEMLYK